LSSPCSPPKDSLCIIGEVFPKNENGDKTSETLFNLLKAENCFLINKVLFLLGLWARIDKSFSDAWGESHLFKNIISEIERSEENEKMKQGILFCKKWTNVC
jgi:hypothetical protein